MATKTFKGGTHPPEHKERSADSPIEILRKVAQVVIPVNQHFGAPLKPIVQVGDEVACGQRIADGDGPMTVPLHASISGTVKKIEPRLQANNLDGLCIVIEPNGSTGTQFMKPLDGFKCTREEAIARVRDAGIVGVGGAGFPAHVKLSPPADKPIEFVIANAAECEPYLTIDERVMAETPADVVVGMAVVMRLLGVAKGIIGLEDNKKFLVPTLEKAVVEHGHGAEIKVQLLKTKYPQGGEKMLITALTGREVPSGGLPMHVGCVVQNVGTLKAVAEAFQKGKPVVDTGLTVSGGACETPKNLIVPVGTLVQDLVPDVVRVREEKVRRVVFGGPMMGPALPGLAVPIQKNTSGVLFLDETEAKTYSEDPCIRCGRCMRACSCRLSPALLSAALKADDLVEAEKIGVMDCIECGTCSFVCPAHIQLVQRFRLGKQLVRAKKQKEAQRAAR